MTLFLTPPVSCLFVIVIIICQPFLLFASISSQSANNEERRHCDKNFCDSIVTKCSITNRCSCNFRNDASCAKDCIDCLEEKFGKCCACVDLCPSLKDDSHSSHVGDINKNITDEDLFNVLTETDDIHGRWSVLTSTTGLELSHPEYGQIEIAFRVQDINKTIISYDDSLEKKKCILAFINKHLNMNQCKRYCTSMGASFFRWFHDGCCECVGKFCLNYGIDQPKCLIELE